MHWKVVSIGASITAVVGGGVCVLFGVGPALAGYFICGGLVGLSSETVHTILDSGKEQSGKKQIAELKVEIKVTEAEVKKLKGDLADNEKQLIAMKTRVEVLNQQLDKQSRKIATREDLMELSQKVDENTKATIEGTVATNRFLQQQKQAPSQFYRTATPSETKPDDSKFGLSKK